MTAKPDVEAPLDLSGLPDRVRAEAMSRLLSPDFEEWSNGRRPRR